MRVIKKITIFPRIIKGRLSGSITVSSEEIKSRVTLTEVTRRVTVGINTARIVLANIEKEYTDKWSGGEEVIIKADFSTGTTEIFKGYLTSIKEIFDRFPALELTCEGYGREAKDVLVHKKYTTDTDIGQIASDLIGEYLPTHTVTGVNTSTGITATPVWQGKSLWECIKELAQVYGNNDYDFYVDTSKDWNFFQKGTKTHGPTSQIAIVYGQNHHSTSIDDPMLKKANKVTVIGQSVDGVPLMATRKNDADIDKYWVMHKIIRDTNKTTQTEVDTAAEKQLANLLNPGRSGTVVSDGLPGMLPGYKVMIYDPHNRMKGYFVVSEIKHSVSRTFRTSVKIHEAIPRDPIIIEKLKKIDKAEQEGLGVENEYGMENTYSFTFEDDTDIKHDRTETDNGSLVLQSGQTDGIMITDTHTANENITYIVLRINGTELNFSRFYVSVNDGLTWEEIQPNQRLTVAGTGKHLKIKVNLKASGTVDNPNVQSLSAMYK